MSKPIVFEVICNLTMASFSTFSYSGAFSIETGVLNLNLFVSSTGNA